jgi:benzylsuccinate CoA-transferase BbsF subunit
MALHGIYPAAGDDSWIAIACRDDDDWLRLAGVIGEPWTLASRFSRLSGRLEGRDVLESHLCAWTVGLDRHAMQETLRAAGVPASKIATPADRIEQDQTTADWGLWPSVRHPEIGNVRVDGVPLHLSESDWAIARGAPCLGEHNQFVLGDLLGLSQEEIDSLSARGVI